MLRIAQIARPFRSTEGSEIAEAAIVFPLLFTLLLGIIWFGRAFNIYSTITQAAQQGAITAARSSCGTCSNAVASDATVTGVVEAVMKSSSLDIGQVIVSPKPVAPIFCTNPPNTCNVAADNVKVCHNVLLNPPAGGTQPPQCGTVVSFEYKYTFFLPFTSLNLQQVNISAQAQSRMEN